MKAINKHKFHAESSEQFLISIVFISSVSFIMFLSCIFDFDTVLSSIPDSISRCDVNPFPITDFFLLDGRCELI